MPAAIVARELGVRVIDTVCIASYDHDKQGDLKVLKGISADVAKLGGGTGKGLLIVDDLVDTGKTGRLVRDMMPDAHFATVYAKPKGRPLVDTFITEVSQDTWIFFPWDTALSFQPPIRDGAAWSPSLRASKHPRRRSEASNSMRNAHRNSTIRWSLDHPGMTIGLPMPLQNRVTPTGDIVATPHRGLFTGNRGIIHDPATKTLLKKRWSSPAWIICVCEFRGRRRKVMGGRSWTELFFLDEATAFAAGHRPCFFCRRDDANRFRAAWEAGQWRVESLAREMDAVLHRERLDGGEEAAASAADAAEQLPDGAMVQEGDGELSDRAGQGAAVVDGRLSRGGACDGRRDAADAAIDAARIGGGLSAGAASECGGVDDAEICTVIPGRASARTTMCNCTSENLRFGFARYARAPE